MKPLPIGILKGWYLVPPLNAVSLLSIALFLVVLGLGVGRWRGEGLKAPVTEPLVGKVPVSHRGFLAPVVLSASVLAAASAKRAASRPTPNTSASLPTLLSELSPGRARTTACSRALTSNCEKPCEKKDRRQSHRAAPGTTATCPIFSNERRTSRNRMVIAAVGVSGDRRVGSTRCASH